MEQFRDYNRDLVLKHSRSKNGSKALRAGQYLWQLPRLSSMSKMMMTQPSHSNFQLPPPSTAS